MSEENILKVQKYIAKLSQNELEARELAKAVASSSWVKVYPPPKKISASWTNTPTSWMRPRSGNCYVYELAYPDGVVFYVGKGADNRMWQHSHDALKGVQTPLCCVIRAIWKCEEKVITKKVASNLYDQDALRLEQKLIRQYGYEQLVNCPPRIGGEKIEIRRLRFKARPEYNPYPVTNSIK